MVLNIQMQNRGELFLGFKSSELKCEHINPGQTDKNGSTALAWAATAGQKECCKKLVKCGGSSVEQLEKLILMVPHTIQEELTKGRCSGCGRARQLWQKFRGCSRCKKFWYCCKDCQRKHWKNGHKKECIPEKLQPID